MSGFLPGAGGGGGGGALVSDACRAAGLQRWLSAGHPLEGSGNETPAPPPRRGLSPRLPSSGQHSRMSNAVLCWACGRDAARGGFWNFLKAPPPTSC